MTANSKDPSAVQGPWAWWGGEGSLPTLGVWLTCSGNRGEQGFPTAGLGAVQSHLILQGSRSGLRGSWPQIQHFRGQGPGEGHREEARKGRGPQEGAQAQNKMPAGEGGKAAPRDSSLPPCFRQVPPNTQRGIVLSVSSLSICLSLAHWERSPGKA